MDSARHATPLRHGQPSGETLVVAERRGRAKHKEPDVIVSMDFSAALALLKEGKRVARAGWNGKGMWLRKFDPYSDREFGVRELNPADMPDSGTLAPWIGMHTADNKFVPWLASQTDLLAEDWQIADVPERRAATPTGA